MIRDGNKTGLARSALSNPGTFISYDKPTITSVSGDRVNGTGNKAKMTLSGTFWNDNFGATTNAIQSIKYRSKVKTSSEWTAYTTLTTSQYAVSGKNITISGLQLGTTFNLGTEYTVEVLINDKLDSVSQQFNINSGRVLYSIVKGKGVCFGGLYNSSNGGALQLAGNKVLGFSVENTWN